jgi:hypothetical protein
MVELPHYAPNGLEPLTHQCFMVGRQLDFADSHAHNFNQRTKYPALVSATAHVVADPRAAGPVAPPAAPSSSFVECSSDTVRNAA